jgi:hypothetical protein
MPRKMNGAGARPAETNGAAMPPVGAMDATAVSTGAPVEKPNAVLTGASVETPAELIPFTEAVREGKKALGEMSKAQWKIGELADTVRPDYAQGTLARFADAIGLKVRTVERYRDVWRAWKHIPAPGRESLSYSVARELADVPNRADFVSDNPLMSRRRAEEIAKQYRDQQKKSAANDEGNKKKSGRARTYANQLIEVLEDVDVTPWGQQPGLAFIFVRVAAAAAKAAATLEPSQADLLLPIAAAAAKAADALDPQKADPKSAKPSKAA